MKWYEEAGKKSDIILSSRVRIARNAAGYPFPGKISDEKAGELINKVLSSLSKEKGYEYTDLSSLDLAQRKAMADEHLISDEFACGKSRCGLLSNEEKNVYIMLMEEDHVRIQCILPGFALTEAYRNASETERKMDGKIDFAFSDSLGYLTKCPTNLGTGMRASVMMFLPALTYARRIRNISIQLSKIGFTIRGNAGEGSKADGFLYQISNEVTLGKSEDEILKELEKIILDICESETKIREEMKKDSDGSIRNRIMRSYGILKYATMIDSTELLRLYADCRLGVSLGFIENINTEKLDRMLVKCMPASLMARDGKVKTASQRDALRTEVIKEILK